MPTRRTTSWSSDLEVRIYCSRKSIGHSEIKRELSWKSPVLPPSGTTESVACKISSYTTRQDDVATTRSSTAPVMSSLSVPDRLLRYRTSDNRINLPLWTLLTSTKNVQFVGQPPKPLKLGLKRKGTPG